MEIVFEQVLSRIHQTPLIADPFSHLIIENLFPSEFYDTLLKHLPDSFFYQPGKFYPMRRAFPVNDDHLVLFKGDPHLFQFWSKFKEALCSDRFLSVILEKFNVTSKSSLSPEICLLKDKDQYSIGPHTDIPQRVLTLLFYLPSSRDQAHLGTALYRPLDPQFSCPLGTHYDFESFVKVSKVPFLPNTLFGFVRTNSSFHGVELIGSHEKERNLLSYTVWRKGSSS